MGRICGKKYHLGYAVGGEDLREAGRFLCISPVVAQAARVPMAPARWRRPSDGAAPGPRLGAQEQPPHSLGPFSFECARMVLQLGGFLVMKPDRKRTGGRRRSL